MDLTLQSYLNEAVFSAGRGPGATFVSYLQSDDSKERAAEAEEASSSTASNDKSDFVSTGKGSFISYIDDDSDSDEFSVGLVVDTVVVCFQNSFGQKMSAHYGVVVSVCEARFSLIKSTPVQFSVIPNSGTAGHFA